ncbi:hypothetical protein KM043_003302 [Ampulex compressa]|nr:hypothetical protein KM043_003302 [Ampulex compressa]
MFRSLGNGKDGAGACVRSIRVTEMTPIDTGGLWGIPREPVCELSQGQVHRETLDLGKAPMTRREAPAYRQAVVRFSSKHTTTRVTLWTRG